MEINEIEMQASSTSILTPPLARRNRAHRGFVRRRVRLADLSR